MMTVLLPVNVYMSLSLLLHVSNIYTEEEADLENCLFLNIFFFANYEHFDYGQFRLAVIVSTKRSVFAIILHIHQGSLLSAARYS